MNPLIINLKRVTETVGLTKYAPEEMKQNTFRNIIEFMINERPDEINPGYNAIEKKTASELKNDYEADKNSKAHILIQYISEKDFRNISVNLEDKICTQQGIFHKRTDLVEGENTPFEEIQLVYHAAGGGGIND